MTHAEEQRMLMFLRVIRQSGIREEATEDAYRKLKQQFQDQEVDPVTVRSHVDQTIRYQAPHYWPQSSGNRGAVPPPNPGAGIDWDAIKNPQERLTRWREHQAAQQQAEEAQRR